MAGASCTTIPRDRAGGAARGRIDKRFPRAFLAGFLLAGLAAGASGAADAAAGAKTGLVGRSLDLCGAWEFRRVGDARWLPATVPGVVHTDLLAAGLIGDPFYRDNEAHLQWIGEENWEYRRVFDVEGAASRRACLVFEGLDTFADVFLNDSLLFTADNMFRRWRAPCGPLLCDGENELRVVFRSIARATRDAWSESGIDLPGGERVTARKAACHFGWDWAPRFLTMGVWRPVRLELPGTVRVKDVRIGIRSLDGGAAACEAIVETEAAGPFDGTVALRFGDETVLPVRRRAAIAAGVDTLVIPFSIGKPRLWWCNGLGEPHLYAASVDIETGGGRVVDSRTTRFGLRTIELVTEPDGAGETFFFRLNGRPVFMKGANHVPADCFLPRAGRARLERIVDDAAAANMNMLRVWGGGVYETDAFYDRCDERGILVWQDFMFACALYPWDEAFLRNVREEAADNLRRLRGHPCIALWCGNNEIDEAWRNWGWRELFDDSAAAVVRAGYEALFHELLPGEVARHAPGAAYEASSPRFGRADPRSFAEGDAHYWGVWHDGEPFAAFEEKVPRFMSEFGFQSLPGQETVAGFTLPGDWAIDSPVMRAHQRHPSGNELIRRYLGMYFREPVGFGALLSTSQLLQALGVETAIHAHRRSEPYCMGSLYWQLGDCWPVASWSGIDYHGRWKALHAIVRRAFADVLVSCVRSGEGVRVCVVNDGPERIRGRLQLELVDFRGERLWERSVDVDAESGLPWIVEAADAPLAGREKEVVLVAALDAPGGPFAGTFWFVPPKDLRLEPPGIEWRIREEEGAWIVDLAAARVARWVGLSVANADASFDDNWFDLVPGREKRVRILRPRPADGPAPLLGVTSLHDLTRSDEKAR